MDNFMERAENSKTKDYCNDKVDGSPTTTPQKGMGGPQRQRGNKADLL